MDIRVEPILYEQKSVFIQMLELYNYDFSEFSNDDINEYGYFGYEHIDDYWNEEGRHPFFIKVNGKLAGLVLVRSCCEHNNLPNPHNIAEFFVMKKYRQRGVDRYEVHSHKGKYLIQICSHLYIISGKTGHIFHQNAADPVLPDLFQHFLHPRPLHIGSGKTIVAKFNHFTVRQPGVAAYVFQQIFSLAADAVALILVIRIFQ